MSEDEYTHRQFWLPIIKWTEIIISPNPKLYKETGKLKSEILWYTTNEKGEKIFENNKNRV